MTGAPLTYWLLTGELPTGPFTADEIRAKVARGEVRADAPACPLGGGDWTPADRVPGLLNADEREPTVPTAGDPTYWLSAGSVPTGPFPASQIRTKLAAGEVAWETPACPVGTDDWRPLARTPGFGPPFDGRAEPDHPGESEHLPPAALLIGYYGLLASPVLLAVSWFATYLTGPGYAPQSAAYGPAVALAVASVPVDLWLTVALARASAAFLGRVPGGARRLHVWLVWSLTRVIAGVLLWLAVAARALADPPEVPEAPPTSDGVLLGVFVLAAAAVAVQVFGLFWLRRHGREAHGSRPNPNSSPAPSLLAGQGRYVWWVLAAALLIVGRSFGDRLRDRPNPPAPQPAAPGRPSPAPGR